MVYVLYMCVRCSYFLQRASKSQSSVKENIKMENGLWNIKNTNGIGEIWISYILLSNNLWLFSVNVTFIRSISLLCCYSWCPTEYSKIQFWGIGVVAQSSEAEAVAYPRIQVSWCEFPAQSNQAVLPLNPGEGGGVANRYQTCLKRIDRLDHQLATATHRIAKYALRSPRHSVEVGCIAHLKLGWITSPSILCSPWFMSSEI